MTVIEVGGLVLVVVLAAIVLARGDGEPGRLLEFDADRAPAMAVLAAALLAYYSFVGFETSANIAEEVRDVRRVYPRALFGALLTAGAVYVLVGMAVSIVLPPEQVAASTGPLLEVVSATNLGVPDRLFGAIALVAVANGALLTMIMASRLLYGMASHGLVPSVFGRVLPRRRTPWVAILATTAVAMVLCTTSSLDALAETVVLLLLFVFVSTNVAVLVLRRDRVGEPHFRTDGAADPRAADVCRAPDATERRHVAAGRGVSGTGPRPVCPGPVPVAAHRPGGDVVIVGVVADPGFSTRLAQILTDRLPELLRATPLDASAESRSRTSR